MPVGPPERFPDEIGTGRDILWEGTDRGRYVRQGWGGSPGVWEREVGVRERRVVVEGPTTARNRYGTKRVTTVGCAVRRPVDCANEGGDLSGGIDVRSSL